MKIYNYDRHTGEFTGASVADKDPVGLNGWLTPAHATAIEAPTVKPGFVAVFDEQADRWLTLQDNRGIWFNAQGQRLMVVDISYDVTDLTRDESPGSEYELIKGQWTINQERVQASNERMINMALDAHLQAPALAAGCASLVELICYSTSEDNRQAARVWRVECLTVTSTYLASGERLDVEKFMAMLPVLKLE